MSVERAIQNHNQNQSGASRLSKVIEDSVRKDAPSPPEKRSIYATNRPNPPPASEPLMEGLACPRGNASSPSERKTSLTVNTTDRALPQVEGLAARFDTYFEKEKAATRGEGIAGRFSSPDISNSRPTSTGSKSSLHTPDILPNERQGEPLAEGSSRKRSAGSPPPISPGAAKKQSLNTGSSSEGDKTSGSAPDETRRWQDEISMGFDRLVAMASEVDKRRKSAENSPQQGSSPRKVSSGADLRMADSSFDQSNLAMRFKAGLLEGGGGQPQRGDKPAGEKAPQSSFPGENLPEHHFKKKYFNAEYQRQQQRESESNQNQADQQRQSDKHKTEKIDTQRPSEQQRLSQYDQRHSDKPRGGSYERQAEQRGGQQYDQQGRHADQQHRSGQFDHRQADQRLGQYDQQERRDVRLQGEPRYDQRQSQQPSRYDQHGGRSRDHGSHQAGSSHRQPPDQERRHMDQQRMYQQPDSRRGHYEQQPHQQQRHLMEQQQRHHDRGPPPPPGSRQAQMYQGPPGGYSDMSGRGPPPTGEGRAHMGAEYQGQGGPPRTGPGGHPDQFRPRGPPPGGPPGGYPGGHPYNNPQLMQAMAYRHRMMFANRPPPPPPK